MCGIVGAVNKKINYESVNVSMGHRGPDERHGYTSDNIDFYHLRLSIVDLRGGRQPMQLNSRYTIIFNGEIYNHLELRKQFNLKATSPSDTETLLLLYEKLGPDFLQYVDGMFALAIYDEQKKEIFIARDRAGKKPLYLYKKDGIVLFASELNCLSNLLPLEINNNHFLAYLRLGSFYGSQTPYKYVEEIPAGSYYYINCSTTEIRRKEWWHISDYYLKNNDDEKTALATIDNHLHTSVKRRMLSSDLEVGCFLSGGIDSGLVTAVASQYTDKLKTFTVSFSGEYDEAPLAKEVADKYNTDHRQINISFTNLKDDLTKIISNYGEPFFDSSAIPSYYVSEEAKKYVTVILNGDGADELFGGYRRYVPFAKYDFFKSPGILQNVASLAYNIAPTPSNKKSKYNYLYRLLGFVSKRDLELYLAAGVDIFEGYESNFINATEDDYLKDIRVEFRKVMARKSSGLDKIMELDFTINLFSDLLVKMDIANMAHSLEGRSPFLSKELMEYAPGMADNLKINGSTTKYALRKLSEKYLPENLHHQPKRGFEIPLKNWVNGELKDIIHDYLGSSNALCKSFIDTKFLKQLLDKSLKVSEEKRAKMLWTLMSMEIWYSNVYLKNTNSIA